MQIAINMAQGADVTATMTMRAYCIPKDQAALDEDKGGKARAKFQSFEMPGTKTSPPMPTQSLISKAIRVN